jgi:hypothetical protein
MLPAGNLRRPETWEAFFEAGRKTQLKPSSSSQNLARRATGRDLSQPKRSPSADRVPPAAFSPPPASAPHHTRSPKAVKHITPLNLEGDAPAPTSLPPSPVKMRTSSVPLRPHTARSRVVYEGPPVRFIVFPYLLLAYVCEMLAVRVQYRDPARTHPKPRLKRCPR